MSEFHTRDPFAELLVTICQRKNSPFKIVLDMLLIFRDDT